MIKNIKLNKEYIIFETAYNMIFKINKLGGIVIDSSKDYSIYITLKDMLEAVKYYQDNKDKITW